MSDWGRDPLQILLERESRTCKGCIHIAVAFDRQYCDKKQKFGQRCKQYSDIKSTRETK